MSAMPCAPGTRSRSASYDAVRGREPEPGAAHSRLQSEGMSLGATPIVLTKRRSSTSRNAVRGRKSKPRAAHPR
jgi:hypothetical protein